jgi:molybdate transport system substrate-binding protein
MEAAVASGRVVSGTQATFARNPLVVVTPGDNPAGIRTPADLARPGVKIVLAAPEVPAGQYALEFLDKAEAEGSLGGQYREAVAANVVSYEESVRGVLAKVVLGEADAGIVYASDAAVSAGEVQAIEIPDRLNTIAAYPIAVVADSSQAEVAQEFVEFVLGAEGQGVLGRYGFLAAGG